MFSHHLLGSSRRSFIAGKSCHNQKIESLWRDEFSVVLSIFYRVFWYLEENGYLDISDEVRDGIITSLSTERSRSPNQPWALGQIDYGVPQDPLELDDLYGIDIEGPLPERETDLIEPAAVPPILTSVYVSVDSVVWD